MEVKGKSNAEIMMRRTVTVGDSASLSGDQDDLSHVTAAAAISVGRKGKGLEN
jgi:hypothetical protein